MVELNQHIERVDRVAQMRLFFAGVSHYDPWGRIELRAWLKLLQTIEANPPEFVAVEWSQPVFMAVKQQRGRFRRLLQTHWPKTPPDLLDILESTLAYEADTHIEFFPSAEIVWIDAGREHTVQGQGAMQIYAESTRNTYFRYLKDEQPSLSLSNHLTTLRKKSAQFGDLREVDLERDKKWAEIVIDRAQGMEPSRWTIIIVGAVHTIGYEGNLRSLLERHGFACQVDSLLYPFQ